MEPFYEKGELVYVCGYTGSGKTTLLKTIKKELKDRAGYVMQNPDNQIVTNTVHSELAFGLGDNDEMRVAETASWFGISKWLYKNTSELSGGEKQILCIASVMACKPEMLLLDEPTSMLDPVSAHRVISLIKKLNQELSITIIVAGHKPDEFFADADKIVLVRDCKNEFIGSPTEAVTYLKNKDLVKLLPSIAQIWQKKETLPLTLRDAKMELEQNKVIPFCVPMIEETENRKTIIKCNNISYSYEKYGNRIINGLDLEVYAGEIISIVGENGSGKTTLSYILSSLRKPYSGKIKILGKPALLCQDVTNHFLKDDYDGVNPYELSGGEQQKLALKLILEKDTDILVLDEPTKGLDGEEKQKLENRLRKINAEGVAIIIMTHDIEFAAEISNRTGMLFAGRIYKLCETRDFFRSNVLYKTVAGRLFEKIDDNVMTVREAGECL